MRRLALAALLLVSGPAAADMYQDASNSKTDTAFKFGTGLYPQYAVKHATTANTTNGSPTITVADASGIAVGDNINNPTPNFLDYMTYVTAIAGTTVTMSRNATATLTGASVWFGADRFEAGKTLMSNTIAGRTGLFGAASKGHSTWVGKYWSGADYPSLTSVFGVSEYGTHGGLFASRSSDSTGQSVITLGTLLVDDGTSLHTTWNNYHQSNLEGSVPGTHIQTESSIYTLWTPVELDPYTPNRVGGTENLRLDCGIDRVSNDCSVALHIITNAAKYKSGIIIGDASVVPAGGLSPAIELPANYAIDWFAPGSPAPAGTRAWRLASNATAGNGTLNLGNAGVVTATAPTAQFRATDPGTGRSATFGMVDGYNVSLDAAGGGATWLRNSGQTYIELGSGITKVSNLQFSSVANVAGLPACNAGTKYALIPVSDQLGVPTYRGALTGGGSLAVLAFCNGAAWEAH